MFLPHNNFKDCKHEKITECIELITCDKCYKVIKDKTISEEEAKLTRRREQKRRNYLKHKEKYNARRTNQQQVTN